MFSDAGYEHIWEVWHSSFSAAVSITSTYSAQKRCACMDALCVCVCLFTCLHVRRPNLHACWQVVKFVWRREGNKQAFCVWNISMCSWNCELLWAWVAVSSCEHKLWVQAAVSSCECEWTWVVVSVSIDVSWGRKKLLLFLHFHFYLFIYFGGKNRVVDLLHALVFYSEHIYIHFDMADLHFRSSHACIPTCAHTHTHMHMQVQTEKNSSKFYTWLMKCQKYVF